MSLAKPTSDLPDDLIALLRCPRTHQALELRALNKDAIPVLWETLSSRFQLKAPALVLVTSDAQFAYPVWDEVIGLQTSLAMERGVSQDLRLSELRHEKQVVADFYDTFGWRKDATGFYKDAIAFEDLREITAPYRQRCHRRVNRHLGRGRFLLDAASGAVQIPEYVRFSDHYELRICVDLSLGGLIEAKRRLGSRAVCILADITQLPFADEAMDAFVSLHTIYHIPVDEQSRAIAELYRTLQSGGRGVVVYSWGGDAPLLRWYRHWVLRRKAALTVMASGEPTEAMPDLYFHPQNYAWYRREIAAQYPVKLRVWRSVERDFLETIIRSPVAALMWLWPLYLAEQLFPAWFGRIGICPMFVFNKPLR